MTLKVLLVDDESLARSRMRSLLAECQPPAQVTGEAAEQQPSRSAAGGTWTHGSVLSSPGGNRHGPRRPGMQKALGMIPRAFRWSRLRESNS